MAAAFEALPQHICDNLPAWRRVVDAQEPQNEALPAPFEAELAPFDRLLLVRMLRPDKLIPAVRSPPHC